MKVFLTWAMMWFLFPLAPQQKVRHKVEHYHFSIEFPGVAAYQKVSGIVASEVGHRWKIARETRGINQACVYRVYYETLPGGLDYKAMTAVRKQIYQESFVGDRIVYLRDIAQNLGSPAQGFEILVHVDQRYYLYTRIVFHRLGYFQLDVTEYHEFSAESRHFIQSFRIRSDQESSRFSISNLTAVTDGQMMMKQSGSTVLPPFEITVQRTAGHSYVDFSRQIYHDFKDYESWKGIGCHLYLSDYSAFKNGFVSRAQADREPSLTFYSPRSLGLELTNARDASGTENLVTQVMSGQLKILDCKIIPAGK